MTPDEHQRERMRAWIHVAAHTDTDNADYMLAAFDKRFPAPAAVEVAPALPKAIASTWPAPDKRTLMEWTDHLQKKELHLDQREALLADELAALREKARYWDAMWPVWYGQEDDAIHAARKVIDAGALK